MEKNISSLYEQFADKRQAVIQFNYGTGDSAVDLLHESLPDHIAAAVDQGTVAHFIGTEIKFTDGHTGRVDLFVLPRNQEKWFKDGELQS